MKCPYCGVAYNEETYKNYYGENEEGLVGHMLEFQYCPECEQPIVYLSEGLVVIEQKSWGRQETIQNVIWRKLIYPKYKYIKLSNHIPEKYRKEYEEAAQVVEISPKASATLARRLLQLLLENECNVKRGNLEDEIKDFQKRSNVTSQLIKLLTVLRKVANFGAHPKKNTSTGEIVEVANGEAELLMQIIEQLFDYIFVKPAELAVSLEDIKEKYGIDIDIKED